MTLPAALCERGVARQCTFYERGHRKGGMYVNGLPSRARVPSARVFSYKASALNERILKNREMLQFLAWLYLRLTIFADAGGTA